MDAVLAHIVLPHLDDETESVAECVGEAADTLHWLLWKGVLPQQHPNHMNDWDLLLRQLWDTFEARPALSYSGLVAAAATLRKLMRCVVTLAHGGGSCWYEPLESLFGEQCGDHTFSSMQHAVCSWWHRCCMC